jgi:hypothetical protein
VARTAHQIRKRSAATGIFKTTIKKNTGRNPSIDV